MGEREDADEDRNEISIGSQREHVAWKEVTVSQEEKVKEKNSLEMVGECAILRCL
jgi:hypothetical protein